MAARVTLKGKNKVTDPFMTLRELWGKNTIKKSLKPWLVWLSGLRVAGSIPSQGPCLGCGPGPQ